MLNEFNKIDIDKLRYWYNGYSFGGAEAQRVYNPFDILLFFANDCPYKSYWFETATPTFLIKLIEKNNYFFPELENIVVGEDLISSFNVDNISIEALLFQSGYLTIKEVLYQREDIVYRLSYPNYEVKSSLNKALNKIGMNRNALDATNINTNTIGNSKTISNLLSALINNEFDNLKQIFTSHFASIPYNWYVNNNIDQYEGFYASIVYAYFNSIGQRTIAEDVTNQGRIDMTIITDDKILIIEFTLNKYGSAIDGIEQIKNRRYYEKYICSNKNGYNNYNANEAIYFVNKTIANDISIYLISMIFDPNKKNLPEIIWEKVIE